MPRYWAAMMPATAATAPITVVEIKIGRPAASTAETAQLPSWPTIS